MSIIFRPVTSDAFAVEVTSIPLSWMWYGYLAPVHTTLLTSRWKAGKSTLLAGLLRAMTSGTPFLGREVRPGRALVVTNERQSHWASRVRTVPIDPRTVDFLFQPFSGRKPTLDRWLELVDYAANRVMAKDIQLVVIDPLMAYLPPLRRGSETVLAEFLDPLRRLTYAGGALLLLHRPQPGQYLPAGWMRGDEALFGFADISMELRRFSPDAKDEQRRRIVGQSKRVETPERLTYCWDPNSGRFGTIDDPSEERKQAFGPQALEMLRDSPDALSVDMILDRWTNRCDLPSRKQLDEWLRRAMFLKQISREGKGVKADPFRYRLCEGAEGVGREP